MNGQTEIMEACIDFIPNHLIRELLQISESTRKRDLSLLRRVFQIKEKRILGLSFFHFSLYQKFREAQQIAGRDKALEHLINLCNSVEGFL